MTLTTYNVTYVLLQGASYELTNRCDHNHIRTMYTEIYSVTDTLLETVICMRIAPPRSLQVFISVHARGNRLRDRKHVHANSLATAMPRPAHITPKPLDVAAVCLLLRTRTQPIPGVAHGVAGQLYEPLLR